LYRPLNARPNRIEMLAPSLDGDIRLAADSESLDAQAFVAKVAIERFVRIVLPRLRIGSSLSNEPVFKKRTLFSRLRIIACLPERQCRFAGHPNSLGYDGRPQRQDRRAVDADRLDLHRVVMPASVGRRQQAAHLPTIMRRSGQVGTSLGGTKYYL
jgi:hypothetical protein